MEPFPRATQDGRGIASSGQMSLMCFGSLQGFASHFLANPSSHATAQHVADAINGPLRHHFQMSAKRGRVYVRALMIELEFSEFLSNV